MRRIAEAAGNLGLAVLVDHSLLAALGEDAAKFLPVVGAGPALGGVEIGLVSADRMRLVEREAADLDGAADTQILGTTNSSSAAGFFLFRGATGGPVTRFNGVFP